MPELAVSINGKHHHRLAGPSDVASIRARPPRAPGAEYWRRAIAALGAWRPARPAAPGTPPRPQPDRGPRTSGSRNHARAGHCAESASIRAQPHSAPGAEYGRQAIAALGAWRPTRPGGHGTWPRGRGTGPTWQA